jgi:Domain of unknown function (DUF4394)/PEP-CTERM motif
MKTKIDGRFLKAIIAATLVGVVTFTCVPANAQNNNFPHEAIYAVDFNNNLTLFYADHPETIVSQYGISGIKPSEEIRGIDYWNGTIYAFGSAGYLYTLNQFGVATQVGIQFSVTPNGSAFGVDNDPLGFRIVSNLGQNLLVDRITGAVTQGPNVPQRVDAIAYDSASGKWYAADTLADVLNTLNPNTGALGIIGGLGIDASRYNGFDISPFTGMAYMLSPGVSSDPAANLYEVLLGGGTIQGGKVGAASDNYLFRAMTVAIPEPSSVALLLLGAISLFFARRRQ